MRFVLRNLLIAALQDAVDLLSLQMIYESQ